MKKGIWGTIVVLVVAVGCSNPIPPGPDLVACNCQCTTSMAEGFLDPGNGNCITGGVCEQPCANGMVCDTHGGCFAGCGPGAGSTLDRTTQETLHVCADSSNVGLTKAACESRCQGFASGSILTCVSALLQALGLGDLITKAEGEVPSQLQSTVNSILTPNDAESVSQIIIEECGTALLDRFSGTCGLETQGIGSLIDLLFCIWGDTGGILPIGGSMVESVEVCNSVPDIQNRFFTVTQLNGCPAFVPDGGTEPPPPDAGASLPPVIPVGGSVAPATEIIQSASSLASISGSDVSPVSSSPSGTASTGRIGPILFLTQLSTNLPAGQIVVRGNAVSLSGAMLYLRKPVAAALTDGGAFNIPAGRFDAIVSGSVSGQQSTLEAVNSSSVTGQYDEATGTFLLSGSVALQGVGANVQLELSFGFVNRPPVANAGPDQTVECTLPSREALVHLSGAGSTDLDSGDHIASYTWSAGEAFVASGPGAANSTTTLGLGTRVARLTTIDTRGAVSSDVSRITVIDTAPPVFAPLSQLTGTACDPSSQTISIAAPNVSDACDPASVKITGQITTKNGQTFSTPIPITNGQAALSPGVYSVVWTATDGSGNRSTAMQTLNVRGGFEASDAIAIDDGAAVRLPSGAFAGVGNTGSGTVTLGVQAETGSILTAGNVFLSDRSTVSGDVTATGTITMQNNTTVTGTARNGVPATLPVGMNLAGIVFPASNAGPVDLEPSVSQSLTPGAYGAVSVKSGANLTLSTGTYLFESLDLEPQATLNLNQSTGPIQLYIHTSVIDRGQLRTTAGTAEGFVLGYAGTSTFFIQSPFPAGTVIAPNADVVVASLGANAFSGELFAKDIEVQPNATVTCSTH